MIGLGELGLGEEVVGRKVKVELESSLAVEVCQADVGKVLERLLVFISDELRQGHSVLHGSEPEFRDTLGTVCGGLVVVDLGDLSLLLIVVLVIRVGVLALGDLLLCGLGLSGDDVLTTRVERLVLCKELLLDLEDSKLELGLDLRVLDLKTLEAINTPADSRGERLDVARLAADHGAEVLLGEGKERGVLGSAGSRKDWSARVAKTRT